jgi:hypothetical protein
MWRFPANARKVVLDRGAVGKTAPAVHTTGTVEPAKLEHEHPDLVECRELLTLGNLVRSLGDFRRVSECHDP